jgi:S1-C subfamily serine protease
MYGDLKQDDPAFRYTRVMQAISIRDSNGRTGSAELILQHPDIDICLIRSPDLALAPIAGVVPYRVVQIGERVFSLGNPQGLTFSFGEGIVSQKRGAVDLGQGQCADLIQHSAPQSPGSSGGALLNSAGLLIGITESQSKDGQNLNFAIPAALLWEKYPDGKASNVQITSPLYGAAVTGCP